MNDDIYNYRKSHLDKGDDYDKDLSRGDFNTYMTERELEILDKIINKLFKGRIEKYLDFACGTGRITQHMESMTEKSYGVDLSNKMQDQAKKKCRKTKFIIQDITRDPLNVSDIDLITAFRFFGNAEDELRKKVLVALNKMIKKEGYLVFNDHRNPWSIHNLLLLMKAERVTVDLNYNKIRHLLNCAEFRILRVYGIGAWYIMYRMNKPKIYKSKIVKLIEPLSMMRMVSPFCPDMIIVAQKK